MQSLYDVLVNCEVIQGNAFCFNVVSNIKKVKCLLLKKKNTVDEKASISIKRKPSFFCNNMQDIFYIQQKIPQYKTCWGFETKTP